MNTHGTTPLVSVIIPAYNVEKYVGECIDSVLAQTYSHYEIICVDDGSTDNTIEVIKEYEAKYPGIVKLFRNTGKGASSARNFGFSKSSGDVIQYLDSDDVITPDKFERQLEGLQGDADMVMSDRITMNGDLTQELARYDFSSIEKNPLETAVLKVISTCAPIYRRELVLQHGGYNETLSCAQDWEFNIRMVLTGARIRYIPGVYFINRQLKGSLSSNWIKVSLQACEVMVGMKNELRRSPYLNQKIKDYLALLFYTSAVHAENNELSGKYAAEISTWSEGRKNFISSSIKKAVAQIIGVKNLISLERKLPRR